MPHQDGLCNTLPKHSHRFARESRNISLQNSASTCVAVRSCNAPIFASATSLINGRGVPVRSVRPYPRCLSAIVPRSPLSHSMPSLALSVCPLFRRLVTHRHPEGQRFFSGKGSLFVLRPCNSATLRPIYPSSFSSALIEVSSGPKNNCGGAPLLRDAPTIQCEPLIAKNGSASRSRD